MKKYLFISIACLMGMLSCSKEIKVAEPQQEAEKITFSAGIEMKDATKSTLTGLTITWSTSDKVVVANNINDEVEVCSITRDEGDKTQCTFTVTAVAGAETYYAISIGESDPAGITFNHSTATFSGLNLSKYSFDADHLYDSKIPVAGKSTDKAHFSLKPCVTLAHFRMHEESVAAKHDGEYSGIRGFYFIAKNGDRVIVAGDYTVSLSGDMSVQYVDNGNKKDDKKIESNDLLAKDTDYYFTMLPAGAVTSMEFRFLGFNSNETVSDTEGIYRMATSQTVSLDPGDCFDFGTLNPVGLKKANDAFVPAISIDGNLDDWSAVGVHTGTNTNEKITEWKVMSDLKNVYFYCKIPKSVLVFNPSREGYRKDNFIFVGFDYDNNPSTGASAGAGLGDGFDARCQVCPYQGTTEGTIQYITGSDNRTYYTFPLGSSDNWTSTTVWAQSLDEDNTVVEFMVPRNKIGYPSSGTIAVNLSFNNSAVGRETITLN